MKKFLAFVVVGLLACAQAFAVPALHKLFMARQSDGTVLPYYLYGDEHYHFTATADHYVLAPGASGDLCYAQAEGNRLVPSAIVAHAAARRTAIERQFLSGQKALTLQSQKLNAIVKEARQAAFDKLKVVSRSKRFIAASTTDGLGKEGKPAQGDVSSIGDITIPVVMVQFSDKKFQSTTTKELLTRYFNESGFSDVPGSVGSVKDYFTSCSNGVFRPTFVVVDTVTLSRASTYYGKDTSTGGQDVNILKFVKEACDSLTARGLDLTPYLVDGEIPLISFFYAGKGQATGGTANTIWPHELSLKPSRDYYPEMSIKAGNYYVNSYFVGNEIGAYGSLMGMGVFCHEFSHALGLPDFYPTDYSYTSLDEPFDNYSVMDAGCYWPGSTAAAPVGYNAYEKSYLGWITIPEIDGTLSQTITLANQNGGEGDFAALLRNPNDNREYFIMENYQPSTWYPQKIAGGLLLSHITYSVYDWYYNTVNNNQNAKRAYVITANGEKMYRTDSNSFLFGNGVSDYTSFTYYSGEKDKLRSLSGITVQDNGTVQFDFNYRKDALDAFLPVTNTGMLADGDTVLFVNKKYSKMMTATATGSNYLSAEDVTFSGDTVKTVIMGTPFIVHLNADSTWSFAYGDKWLSTLSTGKVLKFISQNSSKTKSNISFENGNAVVAFDVTAANKTLCYHNDLDAFSLVADGGDSIMLYRPAKANTTTGIRSVSLGGIARGVKSVSYYTLDGRRVNSDFRGLVIRRTVTADGKVTAEKVVR